MLKSEAFCEAISKKIALALILHDKDPANWAFHPKPIEGLGKRLPVSQ